MTGPSDSPRSVTSSLHGDERAGTRPLRVAVAAVALLVLLASTVAAVPIGSSPSLSDGASATPPVTTAENTSARLVLPESDITAEEFATVSLDVAGSTAVKTARMHGRYLTLELREEFAAAERESAQRAVVEETATELDGRIDDLEARQADALAAYAAGQLSTEGLLRELTAIHTAARSLESTISQLYTYDRAVGTPVEPTEIARMKARLVPLQGPVRDRVASGQASEDGTVRVHVTASENGLVLSMIDEGEFSTQYLREAFYGDGFDGRFSNRPISFDEFQDRLEGLYPWVFEQNPQIDTVLTSEPYYLNAGVYGIAINHPHGTVDDRDLVVYYDASTEEVFYEIQRKDVSTVPTRTAATRTTDDGLRIELNATYSDGPLSVRVTNATSGEPVEATVRLNGDRLGRTEEGQLWTIAPSGTFVVTAETADGNVTASATNV